MDSITLLGILSRIDKLKLRVIMFFFSPAKTSNNVMTP